MKKTLVLGLDGATFDVLDPMIEEGHMPNLETLMADSARVPLDSTMPPVTGPAWLSLATGKSPGRTGIYDFLHRDPASDGFDFKYIDGTIYRGQSLWDYLGDSGVECGVVDYPLLSPAYDINGFMIAGGVGRTEHTVTPESLERDLEQFEKPREHLNLRDDTYEENLDVFFEDLVDNVDRRDEILTHALSERDWDFCWAVIQETDWLQHLMWKCFDDSYPEATSVTEEDRELFVSFWERIDDLLGNLLSIVDDDTNIVIQSDHGFGPMDDQTFRLNTWLKQQGYLVPKSFSGAHWTIKKGLRRRLGQIARYINLKEWAPELFSWGKDKTANMAIQVNSVDLNQTKIFEPGHIESMGGLYVNHQALGDQSVEDLLTTITQELRSLSDEHELGLEIYRPEEIYGHKSDGSPDLIVRMEGGMIQDGKWDKPVIGSKPDRLSQHNGTHNRTGVLIASGPDFEPGKFEKANCRDFTPTMLHLYGLPIPSSMDGEVLGEILTMSREVESIRTNDQASGELNEEEQEAMEKQLRELGYFE